MPWHLDDQHSDCDGWAVVKDSTGDVVPGGCHPTKTQAQKHLAALVLSEENQMNVSKEVRSYDSKMEVRQDGDDIIVDGYAAVFNRLSTMMYGFREKIAPGAFADSMQDDIRALWQHDSAQVLGRTRAGTLDLWEDDRGLGFNLKLPDTSVGRDAATLIDRGDIDQMSFGFSVLPDGDEWTEDDGGTLIRTLRNVKLIEISPVTFPAYTDTSIDIVRSAPDWVQRALTHGANHTTVEHSRARLRLLRKRMELLDLETRP